MNPEEPTTDAVDTAESPIGRVLRDEFRIDAFLGSGGMSKVYRAHQLSVDRPVVVKVMTPPTKRYEEWHRRFLQEARAASRVNHPGIVTIYSFGEEPGVGPFIAMEFVDGVGLRKLLAAVRQFEPSRACRLMAGVCRAMHDAHEAGVVHRDLKPDNIMVEKRDDREVPRVLDFGVAKPSDAMVNTLDSEVVGTPDYMAPEQARKNPVDARTDVYSAGIILYELVFGRRPFAAPEPLQLMFKHVNEPLPLDEFDPAWPAPLRDVLERACAKDPDDRFQSAREMALALEAITDDAAKGSARTRDPGAVSAEMVAPVATPGPGSYESDARDDDSNGTHERGKPRQVRPDAISQRPTAMIDVGSEGVDTAGPARRSIASIVGALAVVLAALAVAGFVFWSQSPRVQSTGEDGPSKVVVAPPQDAPRAEPKPEIETVRDPKPALPDDAPTATRASRRVSSSVAAARGAARYAAENTRSERPEHAPPHPSKSDENGTSDDFHLVDEPAAPKVLDAFGDDE